MASRRPVLAAAERVVAADPTLVWALVADPARLHEWAGVRTVGYMGTELPRAGHNVFVKGRLWPRKPWRIEIESWDAGTAVVCLVHIGRDPMRFEIHVQPEVEPDRIATRIRLVERVDVPSALRLATEAITARHLSRMLSRIQKDTE